MLVTTPTPLQIHTTWTFSRGPSLFPLPGDPPPSPSDFPQVEIGVLNRDKVQKTLHSFLQSEKIPYCYVIEKVPSYPKASACGRRKLRARACHPASSSMSRRLWCALTAQCLLVQTPDCPLCERNSRPKSDVLFSYTPLPTL